MDYEHNFWSSFAGPNCDMRIMLDGIKQFSALGVPASKLVIALPIYGYDYTCASFWPFSYTSLLWFIWLRTGTAVDARTSLSAQHVR